jgi:hypothetical protein
MSRFQWKFWHILVIFELPTLDENFLTFGGHSSERKDLELESWSRFSGVQLDVVFFALPFDDNYSVRSKKWGVFIPGMAAMMQWMNRRDLISSLERNAGGKIQGLLDVRYVGARAQVATATDRKENRRSENNIFVFLRTVTPLLMAISFISMEGFSGLEHLLSMNTCREKELAGLTSIESQLSAWSLW